MATVSFSSFDVFNSMVNGVQSSDNLRYLERKLNEGAEYLNEAGRRVMQRARDYFDAYDFDGIARSVRALKRKHETRWTNEDIRPLRTIAEQQHASLTMQRWMLANPNMRRQWQKERCEGYRRTYFDAEPGVWGERHTDYKKVMNGLARHDEEGCTHFVTYFDAIEEGHEELQLDQQLDILESWDWADHYLALGGDDPSSPSNGSL